MQKCSLLTKGMYFFTYLFIYSSRTADWIMENVEQEHKLYDMTSNNIISREKKQSYDTS